MFSISGYRGDHKALSETDKREPVQIITRKTLALRIDVLASQNLHLPRGETDPDGFKPYVKAELHVGGPNDVRMEEDDVVEKEGEYKGRTKAGRGCDPDFGGETIEFSNVPGVVEELAFLRLTVRDEGFVSDGLAAWACIRLDRLRAGYRMVHLNDCEGRVTGGVLLVKISKVLD